MLRLDSRHSLWFQCQFVCKCACVEFIWLIWWCWWMCWLVNDAKTITTTEIFEGWFPLILFSFEGKNLSSSETHCAVCVVRCKNLRNVNCSFDLPPMPHFCLLDHWSIWWNMAQTGSRAVTWLLHKWIHFVRPILVEVPFHWTFAPLTFLAVSIRSNTKQKHTLAYNFIVE